MTSESHEEAYNNIEAALQGRMPEDCLALFKRFSLCKIDHDAEIKKTRGFAAYQDYLTDPFSRIDGCKNEYYAYDKCYGDFTERYVDLKNYVAEIEGNKSYYDRKEYDKDLKKNATVYNYGLNKF